MSIRMPIWREPSEFYKKYAPLPIPEMLRLHGFVVDETPMRKEDFVYMEEYKCFLLSRGINVDEVYVKKEFSAIYVLHGTNLEAEGHYTRNPNGEKMYTSYYYSLYLHSFVPDEGWKQQIFVNKGIKRVFLQKFEECLPLLGS